MPSLAQLTDAYIQPDDTLPVEPLYVPNKEDAISVRPVVDDRPEPMPEIAGNLDEPTFSKGTKIGNKLFGLNGEERYQTWPEKVLREGLSAAGDVMANGTLPPGLRREDFTDIPAPQMPTQDSTWLGNALGVAPVAASPADSLIDKAQAMSALAGTGGLAGADATLGSAPFLRPALKYENKIYKAPMNGQHLDALPSHLAEEFNRQAMSGEDISNFNFGFMNHKGQFLDRQAALDYAIKEGLVDPHAGQYGALTSTLLADSSKPGTAIEAMAKTNAQPFYSALEHNVDKITQSKMTGDQWLGTLANKPGVKPEELQWTGVQDFLKERGNQPVTKAELQEHLQGNKVSLSEVQKMNEDALMEHLSQREFKKSFENLDETENEHIASLAEKEGGDTKYHGYQLPGGPLSRDTEILTNKGWKRIDGVAVDDIVMTRKDEGGILEWQPVQAVPQVYAENLYHFFSQSIDMRVTENHQMVVKKRRRNHDGIFRVTAKELWSMSECSVPLTGVWNSEGDDTIFGFNANDLAELLGWYLAEGSYKQINGVKNTIQIAQCKEYNPEKCDRLEALLNRMGLPWRYYGDAYGIGIKTINKDLVELFHEQPTSEFKFVPYFFFNQSKSVIQSLLDGLILGDGCVHTNEGRLDRTVFYTKSEQLASDVQILILLIGKNANVRQRPSGLYCVGIKSKEWSSVDDAKFEIAPYNDFAYCVTVENHAIYVRRNGVAAFTGNSNYREMLLTLPNKPLPKEQFAKQYYENWGYRGGGPTWEQLTPEAKQTWVDKANYGGLNTGEQYKSSHWDEPNILAHVRMNDRVMSEQGYSVQNVKSGNKSQVFASEAEAKAYQAKLPATVQTKIVSDTLPKKSLHLEEIQSDWHQQGRDKGYNIPAKKMEFKIKDESDGSFKVVNNEGREYFHGSDRARAEQSLARLQASDHPALITSGVPDAPFKKSWHELALKRMIREAAEKGYDRLSWTPGEAQAARYDLSKKIDNIKIKPASEAEGGKHVTLNAPSGVHGSATVDGSGKILRGFDAFSGGEGKNLSDFVGKDLATKILKTEGETNLAGDGLKIGGEGMKGFYDQIIPKALEKIGKEHGVKVKRGSLPPKVMKAGPEDWRIIDANGKGMLEPNGSPMSFGSKEGAENAGKDLNKIHYIDIPQSLRDTAMHKGFPLFSGGYQFIPVVGNPFEDKKK